MFLSLSKTLAKFGKIRIGTGIRITKKNFFFACIALMCVYIIQAMWYLLVVSFWLVYAVVYGAFLLLQKILKRKKD